MVAGEEKGVETHVVAIVQLSYLAQFKKLFLIVKLGFSASMRK